jgi:hypothetical protein
MNKTIFNIPYENGCVYRQSVAMLVSSIVLRLRVHDEERFTQPKRVAQPQPSYATRSRGLTIVELMVAAAAVCIVVLAAGLILVYGQKSWDQGLRQAKLQRDVSYAMLRIKQSISAGTLAQVDGDGQGVKIFNGSGWIKYRFYNSQHDLRFQEDGGEEQTLLEGLVGNASFVLDPNTGKMVLVDIELEKDGSNARLLSKTMMRNY